MEASRHVEFNSVELVGGVDLAAPMEKTTTSPRALEGRGGRETWWRGRKTGCCALARWRCRMAEQRCDRRAWSPRQHGGARTPRQRSGARSWSRGDLLRCYGEMFFLVWGWVDEHIKGQSLGWHGRPTIWSIRRRQTVYMKNYRFRITGRSAVGT
jgi:hypothetical protein